MWICAASKRHIKGSTLFFRWLLLSLSCIRLFHRTGFLGLHCGSSSRRHLCGITCLLATLSFFFLTFPKFKEYSRLCLEKWASPAYDTVDPRKAGHMAKTHSSYAYTTGLSDAVGKTATPYGKPITRKI